MPFWSLLGRSWALLGRSWGRLGASWAAPGPFLGVILAAGRSLFGAIWEVLLEAWPGACKKGVFGCFSVLLYACLVLMLLSSLAFLAAPPTAKRSLKNHEKPCVFSIRLLGCPCCGKCKENNFQSTGARKTKRKTSEKTTPATFR